jgi:hypothetical protein
MPLDARRFHEKPTTCVAEHLFRNGGLWNTFVLAAKARTLWSLGWQYLPGVLGRLDMWRQAVRAVRSRRCPAEHGALALAHAYQGMPCADFSRDAA